MQQASCLEGGSLLWILPLYLHVSQKSDDDDDDNDDDDNCGSILGIPFFFMVTYSYNFVIALFYQPDSNP